MAYRLPGFLELIIPISFFLAIMMAYGRFYVDSEMIVLESCGISQAHLIGITLSLSLVVMLITALLSLWLKPAGEETVEGMFANQRTMTEFDMLAAGRFQTLLSGKRVTYTEGLEDEGGLINVFINEESSSGRVTGPTMITVKADRGETIVDADGNRFLVLKNGVRFQGKPGQRDYQMIEYEEYGQFIEKEEAEKVRRRRTAISTKELIEDPTPRNLSELQWRLSVVLMVPIIAIMAIPLSKVNPRQGRFTRLVPGMILCFLYVVSLSASRSAIERGQIPVNIGLWWVHGIYLMIVVGLYNTERLVEKLTRPATRISEV
jgi:lipopolysaccharide export system permease protein